MATKPPKDKKSKPFYKPDNITREYERQLLRVAREVGRIISGYSLKSLSSVASLQETLDKYAKILMPWAEKQGTEFVARVNKQDYRAWKAASAEMSKGIKEELRNASVGRVFHALQREQVKLITSLPIESGERVHKLVEKGMSNSERWSEVEKEINRSGEVTASRARLIARTETGRAQTNFLEARALQIGSEGYIWRTRDDPDVRESHAKMEGKFVAWNNPPTLDGMTGHAGTLPNCRCRPIPVIPERLK